MKRILLFTSLVLVILGTMLTASAAPAALPVETAGENSEVVDLAAEGAVAADYTPPLQSM